MSQQNKLELRSSYAKWTTRSQAAVELLVHQLVEKQLEYVGKFKHLGMYVPRVDSRAVEEGIRRIVDSFHAATTIVELGVDVVDEKDVV
nr:MAG: protein B [Guangxi forest noda-like virus]